MAKIDSKIVKYPEPVTQPGRYSVAQQKESYTHFGRKIILTVNNARDEKRSLFVAYPTEVSDRSLLARLVKAFGDDPEEWIGRKIEVAFSKEGKRTIEPVVK